MEPSPEFIEQLTEACEERRARGWRIDSVSAKSYEDGPCCCPFGALLDPSRSGTAGRDPYFEHPVPADVAGAILATSGLDVESATAFVTGFEEGSGADAFRELGARFRVWYDYQNDRDDDAALAAAEAETEAERLLEEGP